MNTSEKRQAANRLNAQKSTGPKTQEGKARISRNALRHGLYADKFIVLPGENRDEYEQIATDLAEEFQVTTHAETIMIYKMTDALWKKRRLNRLEHDTTLEDAVERKTEIQSKLGHHQDKLLEEETRLTLLYGIIQVLEIALPQARAWENLPAKEVLGEKRQEIEAWSYPILDALFIFEEQYRSIAGSGGSKLKELETTVLKLFPIKQEYLRFASPKGAIKTLTESIEMLKREVDSVYLRKRHCQAIIEEAKTWVKSAPESKLEPEVTLNQFEHFTKLSMMLDHQYTHAQKELQKLQYHLNKAVSTIIQDELPPPGEGSQSAAPKKVSLRGGSEQISVAENEKVPTWQSPAGHKEAPNGQQTLQTNQPPPTIPA